MDLLDLHTAPQLYSSAGGGVHSGFPNHTDKSMNQANQLDIDISFSSPLDCLRPGNGCDDSFDPLQLQSDYIFPEYRTLQLQSTGYRVLRAPERRVGPPAILQPIIAR